MPRRASIALLLTGAALALLLSFKTPEAPAALAIGGGTGSTTGGTAAAGGTAGTGTTGTSASGTSGTSGTVTAAKSGTYTGSAVQTRYGNVQVQVTIANGKITNVQMLQYPSDNPRSSSINQSAIPTLIQETLQAQSAQVNAVSGATYTSQGYLQSLQSALDQAA